MDSLGSLGFVGVRVQRLDFEVTKVVCFEGAAEPEFTDWVLCEHGKGGNIVGELKS